MYYIIELLATINFISRSNLLHLLLFNIKTLVNFESLTVLKFGD